MRKTILRFDGISIEKFTFYCSGYPIGIDKVII